MSETDRNDPLLYQQGECNETAGFLFSHRCGEPAVNACVQCQKPICQRHTFVNPENTSEQFCTTCGKKYLQSQQGNQPTGGVRPSNRGDFTDHGYGYGYGYGYDPYFYTGYHYHDYPMGGYGRSRHSISSHDFTDADERSLSGGEPSRDQLQQFENDMGGS